MGASKRASAPLTVALLAATGGCATLDPDHFLPSAASPARQAPSLDGTVEVQASVLPVARGKFVLLDDGEAKAVLPVLCRAKVDWPRANQKAVRVAEPCRPFVEVGSVQEFLPVAERILSYAGIPVADNSRGRTALFESEALRGSLEKAVAQRGLFRRIEPGGADYVLDVWLVEAVRLLEYLGRGYVIDVTAVWRVTRARDGKVVFCDFATGNGASRAVGTNAYVEAMEAAVREMIGRGLAKLSDRPTSLAALPVAGAWPSMGSAVPEGYRATRENLSKLRKGMTEEEVQRLIPAMPAPSCSILLRPVRGGGTTALNTGSRTVRIPTVPEQLDLGEREVVPSPCGWASQVGPTVTLEPFVPFLALTFRSGDLAGWALAR